MKSWPLVVALCSNLEVVAMVLVAAPQGFYDTAACRDGGLR